MITIKHTIHSNIHLLSITLEAIVALHSLNRPNCHYFCSQWVKAVLNMSNLYLKIEYDRILMHRHIVFLSSSIYNYLHIQLLLLSR